MNPIVVKRVGPEMLPIYAQVSIAFEVSFVLDVELDDGGLGGLRLTLRTVEPYLKDYDLGEYDPRVWPMHFPTANWAFFVAFDGETPVGAATVAVDSPGLYMNDAFPGSANLWDIRVAPESRGLGVGRLLMDRAVEFALERGYRRMHVETQNVNVPACRFYRAMGFELFVVNTRAYDELPHETMLIWGKEIR